MGGRSGGHAKFALLGDGDPRSLSFALRPVTRWRERPEQFRKQSLARIPPFTLPLEAAE